MNNPAWICVFLILTLPLRAMSGSSDTVNERIPVRKAEMEKHWQLNCHDTWLNLQQVLTQASVKDCTVHPDLRRELKLCSYIYQPPGTEPVPDSCPDYRGVSTLLQHGDPESTCSSVQKFLENHDTCGIKPH